MIISDLNHFEQLVDASKIEGGSKLDSILGNTNSLLIDLGKNLKGEKLLKLGGKKALKSGKFDKKFVSKANGSSAVVSTSMNYSIS
jgi:hypothetical protein